MSYLEDSFRWNEVNLRYLPPPSQPFVWYKRNTHTSHTVSVTKMQSVKTHEGQGPNLNTIILKPLTSLIRHRRFHCCPLLRPCVALSDVGNVVIFHNDTIFMCCCCDGICNVFIVCTYNGGVQCACWLYSYVIIILLLFDCCVWPVDALMLYLHFRDVGGIVTSNLENQMTFQFGKLHTFDLFTLASSSSANSENILKTATSE